MLRDPEKVALEVIAKDAHNENEDNADNSELNGRKSGWS